MIHRILSAIIAIAYITVAYFFGGGEAALKFAAFLILPLACIWYSEEMGSFTGVVRGPAITSKTPGCLVAFGGWLLLLLPGIIALIQVFRGDQ